MVPPGRQLHGPVSGEDVRRLQTTLRQLTYDPGELDGVYGPSTAAAVRRYQTDRGLFADGIVGNQTWERLTREGGAAVSGPLRRMIEYATGDDDVRHVQVALSAAGFEPGAADGIYGQQTQAAVLAFQEVHGLAADGIVGQGTRDALLVQRLRVSPTIGGIVWRTSGDVTAAELVDAILASHPEYGGGARRLRSKSGDEGGIA